MINIVLIDDEPTVVSSLKLVLQALGYSVAEFSSPALALDHIRRPEKSVDLILSDLKMPQLTGLEVLAICRKERPQTPFVLMSAHATNTDIMSALEAGAKGYLAKPFTPTELDKLVKSLTSEAARAIASEPVRAAG